MLHEQQTGRKHVKFSKREPTMISFPLSFLQGYKGKHEKKMTLAKGTYLQFRKPNRKSGRKVNRLAL